MTSTRRISRFGVPKAPFWASFAAIIAFNAAATSIFFKKALPLAVPTETMFDETAPSTAQKDTSRQPKHATIDNIISKWNLSTNSSNEKILLEKIWNRENNYDPENDLIVFYHPMKSGGTSLSEILETLGGLVPGSDKSGYFHANAFQEDFERKVQPGNVTSKREWWSSQRVLYSHSNYRGYHSSKRQNLARLLHDNNQTSTSKRIQHILMVRDPLAFVSSNFYEWFCTLGHWEREAIKFGLPKTSNESCAYSLEDRTKARIPLTKI